jgi:hypothetical protein
MDLPVKLATLKGDVSLREEADNYRDVVAILNPELRVIRSRCDLQWICQRQSSQRNGVPVWKSFAFCGTKEGLLLRLKMHLQPRDAKRILPMEEVAKLCDPGAWSIIEALPDYYEKGRLMAQRAAM